MEKPSLVLVDIRIEFTGKIGSLISLDVLLTDVVCVRESWKRSDSATVLVKWTAVEFRNWLDGG
jgi:hypothetical protein